MASCPGVVCSLLPLRKREAVSGFFGEDEVWNFQNSLAVRQKESKFALLKPE